MFFDPQSNRIYYTMSGNGSLFYRYFTPESSVIGATRFTATGTVSAMNPGRVRGMFLSGGSIWFGDNNNGNLLRIAFADGVVSGSPATANTSVDWRARGMFLDGDAVAPPANVAPTADFTWSCNLQSCTFDSAPSGDSDGTIVNRAWSFGDGQQATGTTAQHTFSPGTYNVTLTVTDDDGASTPITKQVAVSGPTNTPPTASFTSSCNGLACTFTSTSTDTDGTITNYAWNLGDGNGTGNPVQHTYPAPGTYQVTLTVTDDDGATAATTSGVTVSNVVTGVAFRAAASANGSGGNASVVVPAAVQPGDQLVLFVTANTATTATTPAGWTLLGTQQDGGPDMTSWVFTRTAVAGTAGSTVTATLANTTGKSSRMLVAYSGAGVPSVAASSVMGASSTALATPAVPVAANGSLVVSAWSDKTAAGTGWTLPADVAGRTSSVGTGSGRINSAAGDSPASAGTWPGRTATSSTSGTKGIAWSVVVGPA
jgi:PKD repeat protein